MALLNTNTSLVWFGDATSKCEQIDILNYRSQITSVYYVEDGNTDLLASKKSSLATISTRYRYLDAGTGGLIFVSDICFYIFLLPLRYLAPSISSRPSIRLPVLPCIHVRPWRSVHLPVPDGLSIRPSICPSVRPPARLFVRSFIRSCVCSFVR